MSATLLLPNDKVRIHAWNESSIHGANIKLGFFAAMQLNVQKLAACIMDDQ